jgi:DHA2 family multidrug resistance protein
MEGNSLVEYGFKRVVITITAVICALLQIIDTTIVNIVLALLSPRLPG